METGCRVVGFDQPPAATLSWPQLSARLPSGAPHLPQLTPAERVVVHLLAQGLSNREIASALGKAEATVKNQVSSSLRKLGASTRLRLVAQLR